jgi:cytochrome c oxidase subunit 2
MWKTEHPSGVREINQLHVPINRPVRLTMISQDVIHSFFVPAFRIKHDVLPGRYTYAWFEATKPGTYHLFCAEYCGTQHSGMVGQIIAMEPAQYQAWLSGGRAMGSLSSRGQQQFTSLGCVTCHSGEPGARGPNLFGVYGKDQPLADGRVVKVDEDYIRESILNPTAKVVAGFQPIMPTFAGQVSEETLIELVAYIKSLQEQELQGSAAAAAGNIRPIPEKKVPPPTGGKSKRP